MDSAGRWRQLTDYRQLAGMASKKDKTGPGSRKSVSSVKSRTSEIEQLDKEADRLQEQIDSNPAYVAETYERVE